MSPLVKGVCGSARLSDEDLGAFLRGKERARAKAAARIERDPHEIVYDSIHRFKGLASPAVVLAELDAVIRREDLLYVAFRRARSHRIAVCDDGIRKQLESTG